MADEFDDKMTELLPCWTTCSKDAEQGAHHPGTSGHRYPCPAHYREKVAAALRTERAQGFAEGVEKAAIINCRWCKEGAPLNKKYHGSVEQDNVRFCKSYAIRALIPKEPNE